MLIGAEGSAVSTLFAMGRVQVAVRAGVGGDWVAPVDVKSPLGNSTA